MHQFVLNNNVPAGNNQSLLATTNTILDQPTKHRNSPSFKFDMSHEVAQKNFLTLQKHNSNWKMTTDVKIRIATESELLFEAMPAAVGNDNRSNK